MGSWAEIKQLTHHRTLTFLRQPEAVFWVFAFPVILAIVLGFAFQQKEPVPSSVAVLQSLEIPADGATTGLLERLTSAPLVELKVFPDRDAAERALSAGKVDVLLLDPDATPPKLRMDAARDEAELARLRILVALGEIPPAALEVDQVQERGSRYIDFLFPGLLGMNLMGTGLWAIGFTVADLRQRKVLKRLLVTPMRRSSFLASFILSRLQFLALELIVLTSFGVWLLDVPLRGPLLQFFGISLLGAVSFAGLGLLTASRVKTIEGASGMINLVLMPMWLGSGVFFSYERFPDILHPVLRLLPLTALNDALRKTMLEGAGPMEVDFETGVLLFWLVVPFLLAIRIFRWE